MEDKKNDYFILFMLLYEHAKVQYSKDWNDFSEEITYSNRFSSNNKIISEIDNNADKVESVIKKGRFLYRARIFNKNPYEKYLELCKKFGGITDEDFIQFREELNNRCILKFYAKLSVSAQKITPDNPLYIAYKKWVGTKYKGYDIKDSLPPPKENIPEGRANPKCIRYLYLSEDEQTPVYEVRPIIGQYVSVAKFKVLQDLKIYDFTQLPKSSEEDFMPTLFQIIGEKFSMPNNGYYISYLPTQYITEYIKNMGFDGIRFSSSLNKNGKNIVIFNPDFCKPICSDLVEIKSNKLGIEKPDLLY